MYVKFKPRQRVLAIPSIVPGHHESQHGAIAIKYIVQTTKRLDSMLKRNSIFKCAADERTNE